MLAAGLVLAGCSDEFDENGGGNDNGLTSETGYIKVALNLPSTSGNSFRASNGNDNFDDGVEAEYKVNDVLLALFYGSNETDATLTYTIDLSSGVNWVDDLNDDNITKYVTTVKEIPAPSDGQSVYGLAIINGKKSGYFGIGGSSLKYTNSSTGTVSALSSTKLSDFYNGTTGVMDVVLSKIANVTSGSENFLMLNAPISSSAAVASTTNMGDNHSVTTLVPLEVYDDENKAEGEDPDNIYVERVVAKVTVNVTGTQGQGSTTTDNTLTVTTDDTDSNYGGATVKFENWVLQTTNKKMYPVRNVYATSTSELMPSSSPAWKTWDGYYVGSEVNRFYGEIANPYRVYWGIDPNYFTHITSSETTTGSTLADNFTIYSSEGTDVPTGEWKTMGTNAYCAENTTTAANMYTNNLTGILLKTTFTLKDAKEGDDFFLYGGTSYISNEEDFLAYLNNSLSEKLGEKELSIKEDLESGMTISKGDSEEGAKTLSDLFELKEKEEAAETQTENEEVTLESLADDIWNLCGDEIKYYNKGVTYYYTSLIKHFGDNPTEYESDADGNNEGGTADEGAFYEEAKHLGRYGVLRNNWYELNITSVSGPGEPEIPEPEDPDRPDGTHSFINAQINILSWAKRTQDVEL